MALFSRIKTWNSGEVLFAADLNNEFDNLLNNFIPASIEDASANTAAMQAAADPGGVGTESLATNLLGEIQRIRFKLKQIIGGAQWYSAPVINLDSLITTAKLDASAVTTAKIADGNVTVDKLATDSVSTIKIVDGAVTYAKMPTLRSYDVFVNGDFANGAGNNTYTQAEFGLNLLLGQTTAKTYDNTRPLFIQLTTATLAEIATAGFTSGNPTLRWTTTPNSSGLLAVQGDYQLEIDGISGTALTTRFSDYRQVVSGTSSFGTIPAPLWRIQPNVYNASCNVRILFNGTMSLPSGTPTTASFNWDRVKIVTWQV